MVFGSRGAGGFAHGAKSTKSPPRASMTLIEPVERESDGLSDLQARSDY